MPDKLNNESLRKRAHAHEEAKARAFMKMLAAGARYPDGKTSYLGVKLCREWLIEHLDEDSFEFRLLQLVEIHPDDVGWSTHGVPQGEPYDLIKWIVGEMSDEEADKIEHALENYHCEISALAMEAHKRRTGENPPQAY